MGFDSLKNITVPTVDYKSPKDFTVVYTSASTITASSLPVTISDNSQLVYIRVTPNTTTIESKIYINGVDGITLRHSGGVITAHGKEFPFLTSDVYEVGYNGKIQITTITQHVAYGTAVRGEPLMGKYQVTPTTYDDGDAVPLLLDANGRVILLADVQIGAVELKDASADNRADINDADTARATTTHVLAVQNVDAQGHVPDWSDLDDTRVAVESLDTKEGTTGEAAAVDGTRAAQLRFIGAAVDGLEAGLVAPTAFRSTAVDETAGVAVKGSVGDVYGWNFYNPNTYDVFVRFYNTAQGSVTVGTTAIVETVQVPSLGSVVIKQDAPIKSFSTAITIAATKLVADSDTTAITSDVFAHVYYK